MDYVVPRFKASPFSSFLTHFWPFLGALHRMSFFGQKWVFQAHRAKSEENGLALNFDFTSSRVSQNFLGGPLIPYLGTT